MYVCVRESIVETEGVYSGNGRRIVETEGRSGAIRVTGTDPDQHG